MKRINAIYTATLTIAMAVAPLVTAQPAIAATKACTSNTPIAERPRLSYGDRGECVKVAQRELAERGLLQQRHVTGKFLNFTKAATLKHQKAHGLQRDGIIGPQTWGSFGPSSAPATPASAQPHLDARAVRYSKREGMAIDISKQDRKVRLLENGVITQELDARFGGVKYDKKTGTMRNFPSDNGAFRIFWKHADHKSSLFENAPMPYSMFYNGGEAIHYSADFARVGYNGASHGCTNTRDLEGTRQLYNKVREGTAVVVH